MEAAVSRIFDEVRSRYRHCFVLTQNIRDCVWEEGDNAPFSFPVALCRRISRGWGDRPYMVAYYSVSRGVRLYHPDPSLRTSLEKTFRDQTGLGCLLASEVVRPEDLQNAIQPPDAVLPRLTGLLAGVKDHPCCLVIDSAESMVSPDGAHSFADRAVIEILEHWSWDSRIRSQESFVVLLCAERSRIPPGLVRTDGGYTVIPVTYPGVDEREAFLHKRGADGRRAARLANLTTGFRRIDVEEAHRRNFTDTQVTAAKAEIIRNRCGDALEFVQSSHGLDMANAQPHVRDYLKGLRDLILANRKDPSIPNGLLFVGVPGNGKSHLANAFAHDCGMNMLRFKNVRNQYVGNSERNLNDVLDLLPALAPSVVFMDEIDQVIHARSGAGGDHDGGVEARLLARLLEFMGDDTHRGDIIWIGATNRPDLLDPAMPRRLGRIFPFMNPTAAARQGLIQDLITKLRLALDPDFDIDAAADLMRDYSCDDVEKVIVRAREMAFRRPGQSLANRDVATVCTAFKHNYNPIMYEFIGLLSVEICNFMSDLPWCDDRGVVTNRDDLPWFLQHAVASDGRIDTAKVADRLTVLRQSLR